MADSFEEGMFQPDTTGYAEGAPLDFAGEGLATEGSEGFVVDSYTAAGFGGPLADEEEAAPPMSALDAAAAAHMGATNPLAEFHARFHAEGESKDQVERTAKLTRKEAARRARAEWVGEQDAHLEARKQKNRDDELETQRHIDSALETEPWTRIHELIDTTVARPAATSAAASASSSSSSSSSSGGAAGGSAHEAARMRHILIKLKSTPLRKP